MLQIKALKFIQGLAFEVERSNLFTIYIYSELYPVKIVINQAKVYLHYKPNKFFQHLPGYNLQGREPRPNYSVL